MTVSQLIEHLQMFSEDMEIYVQTCEGDLMSPLTRKHMWLTKAFIDEKFGNLEQTKLAITSLVKGEKRYDTRNEKSGLLVKYVEAVNPA